MPKGRAARARQILFVLPLIAHSTTRAISLYCHIPDLVFPFRTGPTPTHALILCRFISFLTNNSLLFLTFFLDASFELKPLEEAEEGRCCRCECNPWDSCQKESTRSVWKTIRPCRWRRRRNLWSVEFEIVCSLCLRRQMRDLWSRLRFTTSLCVCLCRVCVFKWKTTEQ